MRAIYVQQSPALSTVNIGRNGFAMWVMATFNEVPMAFHVTTKSESVMNVQVSYPSNQKLRMKLKPITNAVLLQFDSETQIIMGFDIPVRGFKSHVRNLVVTLKEVATSLNSESLRTNYRLIAELLDRHAGDLFIPPQ